MYFLFTTPTCPNCPRAKELCQNAGLNVSVIDASTLDGLSIAREYNVLQVPTLVEVGNQKNAIRTISGSEAIAQFIFS